MKHLLLLLLPIVVLFSCTEDESKMDLVVNTYYSKYKFIYNNFDSLGYEKSISLLDEYIEEFPNAQNAYMFQAFLHCKNNNTNETERLFQKALSYDSSNVEVYNQWAALLLFDSTQADYAEGIALNGLKIDNNNMKGKNNLTWIYLFQRKNQKALENSLELVNASDSANINYNRALVVSSIKAKNDSIYELYFPLLITLSETEFVQLEELRNGNLEIPVYYKSLTQ